ncbi:hypothetical protein [Nonomuraea sp. NPDC049725]|uniref:hypothetical protein n=1 Tax=Nonomuraea sp. NPDC049725 TaxID=3154508 RepID=UPI003432EE91
MHKRVFQDDAYAFLPGHLGDRSSGTKFSIIVEAGLAGVQQRTLEMMITPGGGCFSWLSGKEAFYGRACPRRFRPGSTRSKAMVISVSADPDTSGVTSPGRAR